MTSETGIQVAVEALGWLGCALLIVSLLQRRIPTLRVLSLISSAILTAYNVLHGVWPMVAMNASIVVINAVYLGRAARGGRGSSRNSSKAAGESAGIS